MRLMRRHRKVPTDRQRLDALYAADTLIIDGLRDQVRSLENELYELWRLPGIKRRWAGEEKVDAAGNADTQER